MRAVLHNLRYRHKWTCPLCDTAFRAKRRSGIRFAVLIHLHSHQVGVARPGHL